MSALVERIIAARDRLRPLRMQGEENIRNPAVEATEVMADAANALSELQTLLDRLHEHVRPSNWDDDDDPEQVAVWKCLDKLRDRAVISPP